MNKKISSVTLLLVILTSGLIPILNNPSGLTVKATPTYYGNFDNSQLIESNGLIRKWLVENYTINSGCILNLSMNEIIGGKVLDKTIYHNDGTLVGATHLPTLVVGKIGNGIQFDAIDDYITIPIAITGTYSIGVWVYISSNNTQLFFDSDIDLGGRIYYYPLALYVDSATGTPVRYIDSVIVTDGTFISLNEWHYICVTGLSLNLLNEIFIGKSHGSGLKYWFNGILDEITIYNHVLTSNEINIIYLHQNYYEVWDGSTLKYQGTINPDINDFIVNKPTFTPTNYPQLSTVWIGLLVGIVGAIISLGIPWIGFITLGIDLTFLWGFLLDSKVITGYTLASNNQVITLVETYPDLRLFTLIVLVATLGCIIIGFISKLSD